MSHFLLMRLQKNTFPEKKRIKMQRDSFVWFLKEKLHFEVVLTFLSEFSTCEHENCEFFNKSFPLQTISNIIITRSDAWSTKILPSLDDA